MPLGFLILVPIAALAAYILWLDYRAWKYRKEIIKQTNREIAEWEEWEAKFHD